jgi:hypothetical protein
MLPALSALEKIRQHMPRQSILEIFRPAQNDDPVESNSSAMSTLRVITGVAWGGMDVG